MFIVLVLQVALAFQDPPPIADSIVRTAVQEAAAIWAPYGLVLKRTAPQLATRRRDALVLAVEAAAGVPLGRVGVVLGAVKKKGPTHTAGPGG